jgi:Flp pilus assembly protein TadD
LTAGEYPLAREFLQRAAKDTPSARLDLAIAVFHVDGPEPALRLLETSAGGDALLLKASLLEAAGRTAEAEETLNRGLNAASTRPRIVERAAVMLLRLKRNQDALKLLDQAMRAHPDDSDLALARALALGLLDRFPEAESTVRAVELRWPEWDRAYLAHGLLLERAGKNAEARQRLETAAALGSRDPSLRCALDRLAAAPGKSAECACLTGLESLLGSACSQ